MNDYQLNIKPSIYLYKTIYIIASVVLNVATYWLALPFISLVNNVSVISNSVTKIVTQKKGHFIRRPIKAVWNAS